MFWGLAHLSDDPQAIAGSLVFGGMAAIAVALVFAWRTIRCSVCGAHWVWLAMSGKRSDQWLAWLLSETECPTCKGARPQ